MFLVKSWCLAQPLHVRLSGYFYFFPVSFHPAIWVDSPAPNFATCACTCPHLSVDRFSIIVPFSPHVASDQLLGGSIHLHTPASLNFDINLAKILETIAATENKFSTSQRSIVHGPSINHRVRNEENLNKSTQTETRSATFSNHNSIKLKAVYLNYKSPPQKNHHPNHLDSKKKNLLITTGPRKRSVIQ